MPKIKLASFTILSALISLYSYGQRQNAFREEFDQDSLKNFRYGSTGVKSNFKWKSGELSAVENGVKVLLMKIDPADSAGAGRGPEIISTGFTHFGTYSVRL